MRRRRLQQLPNLTDADTVVLYPTFAHLVDDGRQWRISVQGAVFADGQLGIRKRLLIRLLGRVMQASPAEIDSDIFRDRVRCFTAETERGKRVGLRVGSQSIVLRKGTRRNGQFEGAVRIPVEEVERLKRDGYNGDHWLEFEVIDASQPDARSRGQAQLLSDTGVSVITDIDDTIKHSDVSSRRQMLANTFLYEFRSVAGMAELYDGWARQGAAFHYVSSSPWQLYEPLRRLCDSAGFPPGSFHLRSFRLRDHMLRRMMLVRRPGKSAVIKSLVETFPQRTFVLIGDSGEKDPLIYASIARRHPDQIAAVFIRQLDERPLELLRGLRMFHGVPREKWHVFRHPKEIADRLPPVTS